MRACEIFHKFTLHALNRPRILAASVRHMVASLQLLAFATALSACGPTITNDNLKVVDQQRLKLDGMGKGLSPKEVESILGQPKRMEFTTLPLETQKKEVSVVRYWASRSGSDKSY